MKIKSSNKFAIIFLTTIFGLVIILGFLGSTNKGAKYPDVPNFEQKTTLDFIQISLNEKHYNKLKTKRDKALSVGILETNDNDYVPATIAYNGKDYKAEIRLKGDWTDHLKGDKWSFRVKLKGDKTILGMRKFSIHHPKTRGYVNEWLYHKAIKSEGLIGLRYGFLEGAIHIKSNNSSRFINKALGVYAIEETFDKRTIENNGRKESIILKYSENLWWDGVKKGIAVGSPSGLHWWKFNKSVSYPITAFSEDNILKDSIMHNYFKLGKNLLRNAGGKIAISDAYDAKKLAMHNAILNLFGASHGNSIINLRVYYNPITSRLEPIAFDGNAGVKLKKYEHYNFAKTPKEDSLYTDALASSLIKVSSSEYLDNLIKTHKAEISNFNKILKDEFNINGFSPDNLSYNQKVIIEEIKKLKSDFKENEKTGVEMNDNPAIVKNIELLDFSKWRLNEINAKKLRGKINNSNAYSLSRKTKTEPSYLLVDNVKIKKGKNYKFSIILKKESNSSFLGCRMQANYPSRVDVVFDAKKALVKDVYASDEFKNVKASIKQLEGDWYECTIVSEIFSENIRVILGPTNSERNVKSWEASIKSDLKLTIVPNSITFEEIGD